MATKKKLLEAAAGNAGGGAGGLNVEEVFSTYLYTGNGSTQTITNGIDLAGEGGLAWLKQRDATQDHMLFDTERGTLKRLISNTTNTEYSYANSLTSYNSDGFTIGSADAINANGDEDVSWTFRKAPKFFDVVTYTGDGTNGRQIPHNLGSNIGMVICKGVDVSTTWAVKHKDRPTDEGQLNSTNAFAGYGNFPTSFAGFTDTYFTVNAGGSTNANGYTYVAYLFAHNDGDGDFGPDGDADIIKCGSFSTDSSGEASVDLGFEPQFLLTKSTTETQNWDIIDVMRGMPVNYASSRLGPNQSDAETTSSANIQGYAPTPTGFDVKRIYDPSETYIYIAIRRGPMAVPESADEVFSVDLQAANTGENQITGWPVDMQIHKRVTGTSTTHTDIISKLLGVNTTSSTANTKALYTSDDAIAGTRSVSLGWDNVGFKNWNTTQDYRFYSWRRASGFFDQVAYTGNGSTNGAVQHSLGAVPEMIWIKEYNNATEYRWAVWHKDLATISGGNADAALGLDSDSGLSTAENFWGTSSNTDTHFYLGNSARTNQNSGKYVSYLFASVDGISSVGSYVGDGSSNRTIDCGFSSGASFILVKKATGSSQNWFVFDSSSGIVSGNDPYIYISRYSEVDYDGAQDLVDPISSGFQVNSILNTSGESYIYYAIA